MDDDDDDASESMVVEEAHFRRVLDMSNKFHNCANKHQERTSGTRKTRRSQGGDRNDYGKGRRGFRVAQVQDHLLRPSPFRGLLHAMISWLDLEGDK